MDRNSLPQTAPLFDLRRKTLAGREDIHLRPRLTCAEPPMHEECAHYALRACPHLAGPKSAPTAVVTARRYRRLRRRQHIVRYRPISPFLRVEWWRGGAQITDRDEIRRLLPDEQPDLFTGRGGIDA